MAAASRAAAARINQLACRVVCRALPGAVERPPAVHVAKPMSPPSQDIRRGERTVCGQVGMSGKKASAMLPYSICCKQSRDPRGGAADQDAGCNPSHGVAQLGGRQLWGSSQVQPPCCHGSCILLALQARYSLMLCWSGLTRGLDRSFRTHSYRHRMPISAEQSWPWLG